MKYSKRMNRAVHAVLWSVMSLGAATAVHAEDMPIVDHSKMDHSQHHHEGMQMNGSIKKSMLDVALPNVRMVRQDGSAQPSAGVINSGKPTVLAFIYTSCTSVCPLTSQIMSQVQDLLGTDAGTRLVSVSIDPEYDTPARLLDYSKRYGAMPQWQHYTGTLADSVAIQKAFTAFQGDKMNHLPLIFVNGGGKKSWVRMDGFPTAQEVVKELKGQIGS